MFKELGWWFPDGEKHLQMMCAEHMRPGDERGNYQRKKYRAAMHYVRNRRRALDIGAHIGLWAYDMVKDFDVVECFEPVERYRECFNKNIKGANLYPFACGDKPDRVSLAPPDETVTGHTVVIPGNDVEVVVLDDYHFTDVDFMKVDCEGYEYFILKGAKKTILENRPVIIVEQKPINAVRYGIKQHTALRFLEALGMEHKKEISQDHIMAWKTYRAS